MQKNRFNALLRAYARDRLSPTPGERSFVSAVYASVQNVIGAANSLQIGSYPRFTAIRPLHDLDVLYILGPWDPASHNPSHALAELKRRLDAEYVNPTHYRIDVSLQTHSVTIKFLEGDDEVFGVDVVPAYVSGTNDRAEDTYVVPEIAAKSRRERIKLRDAVARG